jgi:selenide,water dikinase
MSKLPQPLDPAVVVGTETSDDAGVYRLSEDTAIVCTADFITPVLDDPYLFGQIAASNSLSDVYAMGGVPRAAIALCMFPKELLPESAQEILAGGQAKVSEAGAVVVGGHTVRGEELLYGLSVTGVVHPGRILRNVGARPGDALVLTRPLGTGLIINGLRKGAIDEARARPILTRLAELNRDASRVAASMLGDVHAGTDVTGFGLLGHARNLATSTGHALRIRLSSLPLYPHVREMVDKGVTTGSTRPNRAACAPLLRTAQPLEKFWDELVHDPQTSGGLLLAVDGGRAQALVDRLRDAGVTDATIIGEVYASEAPCLELID